MFLCSFSSSPALVFGGEGQVVAGHQAAIGGAFEERDVQRTHLPLLEFAGAVQGADVLVLEEGIVQGCLGVALVGFHRAAA